MKINRSILIVLLLIWVMLAVIFAFSDLQISKFLVNKNSDWAYFLECYGMIPGLLIILSGIYVFHSSIKTKTDFVSYVQKVILFLAGSGLIYYLFDILFENAVSNNFLIFLIISFAINLMIFLLIHFLQQVKSKIAIKYAKVVLAVTLFGYVVCIQVVKFFWGRVRFRQLDTTFSQFTPWYLPQGITGYDSFPSGHAAIGWILLPLLILVANKKEWVKVSVSLLIFSWAILLDLSRLVIGAHYASDVLFGSFFIIITFLLFNRFYTKKV